MVIVSPSKSGSSPRMRGAQTILRTVLCCVGIIPADAGSTTRQAGGPHGMLGSSPRMRGAPWHLYHV